MGNTVIQTRNDTASNWTTNNPTLALGEIGLETDTKRMKVGDGSTAWTSLGYYGAGASFKYGLYTLSSDQESNFSTATPHHIEFNTSAGSIDGLSTGSGQENGIITLSAGTYKITANVTIQGSGNNVVLGGALYDRTGEDYFDNIIWDSAGLTYPVNVSSMPIYMTIITLTQQSNVDLRFLYSGNDVTKIIATRTLLLIEEYGGY